MKHSWVIFIGAGGHAASVAEALKASAAFAVFGCLDSCPESARPPAGTEILGDDRLLTELAGRGVTHFAVTVGSAGYAPVRKQLFERAVACGLKPLTIRHPSAVVASSATIEPGAQLMAGAVVGAEAVIGANAIINSGVIVEHHCRVGAHAHIASGACLAGGVQVGEESFVGARAVVRQGVVLGVRCVIGMGGVVIRDIAAGATAYGVPAEVVS